MQLRLDAEIFGALQVIAEDEGLMKKAARSLKRLAARRQAMATDENLISAAELDRILAEGDVEIAEGKFEPIAIEDLWK